MIQILRSKMVRTTVPYRRRCLCLCPCGKKFFAWAAHVKQGNTQSCGCRRSTRLKAPSRRYSEGYSNRDHPLHYLYNRWTAMLRRCMNPKDRKYPDYGGRGITVCERWHNFENFLEDMGVPEDRTLSIDRRDNDRGYEPENCRWATKAEQRRNQRPRRRKL